MREIERKFESADKQAKSLVLLAGDKSFSRECADLQRLMEILHASRISIRADRIRRVAPVQPNQFEPDIGTGLFRR
jgi:hypothetical protein